MRCLLTVWQDGTLPILLFQFENAVQTFSLCKKSNVSIEIQQIIILFSNGGSSFKALFIRCMIIMIS